MDADTTLTGKVYHRKRKHYGLIMYHVGGGTYYYHIDDSGYVIMGHYPDLMPANTKEDAMRILEWQLKHQ